MSWNPLTDFCKDCHYLIKVDPTKPEGQCRKSHPQCVAQLVEVPDIKDERELTRILVDPSGKAEKPKMKIVSQIGSWVPPVGPMFGCGEFEPRTWQAPWDVPK